MHGLNKWPGSAGRLRSASPRDVGFDALGQAFRLSAEFISGVAAGGIIGFIVDRLFGTSPWGLVVCIILGVLRRDAQSDPGGRARKAARTDPNAVTGSEIARRSVT